MRNDGVVPIAGTFAGLPQNAVFAAGTGICRINYAGGDGNDVVLTYLAELTAPPLDGPSKLGNGQRQLSGLGYPELTYNVQAKTNLNATNWIHLGTMTADGLGALQYVDSAATNFPMRFYRLAAP